MDDEVERRAEELRQERLEQERQRATATEEKNAALAKFEEALVASLRSKTTNQIQIECASGNSDQRTITFYSASDTLPERHKVVQVSAVHYGPRSSIPVQIMPDGMGYKLAGDGTLPLEIAEQVALLTVEIMALQVARGMRIVSADEARQLSDDEAARQVQEQKAWHIQYEREHRWERAFQVVGFVIFLFVARMWIFPWLRPILNDWFN